MQAAAAVSLNADSFAGLVVDLAGAVRFDPELLEQFGRWGFCQ
jgi:hypothetical protein